jgi:hypothetical protein
MTRIEEYAKQETSMKQSEQSLAYSLTLKMEARCFSGTLVDFQRTTQHYIPEDRTLV